LLNNQIQFIVVYQDLPFTQTQIVVIKQYLSKPRTQSYLAMIACCHTSWGLSPYRGDCLYLHLPYLGVICICVLCFIFGIIYEQYRRHDRIKDPNEIKAAIMETTIAHVDK